MIDLDAVLITLLRARLHPGESDEAATILSALSETDQMSLLRRARRQEVAPLVAGQGLAVGALVGAAAGEAERIVRDNLARNLFLRAETGEWTARLRQRGIPVRVLKGVGQSVLLYANVGARSCADIDLLVRPEDVPAVQEVAAEAGFVPRPGSGVLPDPDLKGVHLRPRDGPPTYELDLHWCIESPRLVPIDHVDFRAREGGGDDDLPPELVGVVLCLHLWRHGVSLKTLLDFAAFVRRFDACLPDVRESLRRAGVESGLDQALALVERVFGLRSSSAGPAGRRVFLPWLEGCLRRPPVDRGRYFNWLVYPLQFDGLMRPFLKFGAHVVRPGVRDGGPRLGSRVTRLVRVAGRALSVGGRMSIRRESTD